MVLVVVPFEERLPESSLKVVFLFFSEESSLLSDVVELLADVVLLSGLRETPGKRKTCGDVM